MEFGRTLAELLAAVVSSLLLGGCLNMSTPPAQITGATASTRNYADLTCDQLADELGTLAKRESPLAAAQDRRVKMSNVQALAIGIGQGDGAAATDLANVRGEREAVRNAMIAKQCGK